MGYAAMLEKSTVSDQDIEFILAERYGIRRLDDITLLDSGSANCYRIQATEGEFILK